jgi:tight adherence protein C
MNLIAFLSITALTVGMGLLWWLVLAGSPAGHRKVVANLNRDLEAFNDPRARAERANSELAEVMRRRTPPEMLKNITRLWASAGRPERWPVDRLLSMKFLLGAIGLLLLLWIILTGKDLRGVLIGIAVAVVMFFLPEILLYNTGIKRRAAIGLQLPDTLDQMSIAVNAGLGFDAAMSRVAKNGRGELANELTRTLQDIQVGMSRRDAYDDLSARTGVDKVERFVRAVVQGETYGIALADVLQSQADELRLERRQDAERRAMQIPVKVIFPLLLFIMPAMFVVVIGPGAISMMKAFHVIG